MFLRNALAQVRAAQVARAVANAQATLESLPEPEVEFIDVDLIVDSMYDGLTPARIEEAWACAA